MKIHPAIFLSAVAGCLVGYLAVGRLDSPSSDAASGRDGNRPARSGESASPSSAPDKSRNGPAGEKRKSFASLLREAPAIAERNKPCKEVERMDAAQLKAAILESIPLRGSLSTIEAEAASAVFSAAVKELWWREGEKALEWAAAEVPAEHRQEVLSEMLVEVAMGSPDLMKVWSDRYRGEYGSRWADRFELPGVTGAAGRGAEELLRVCDLLSTRVLPTDADSYPDDFDFRLLLTGRSPAWDLEAPVTCWAARDKDDSWSGVKNFIESMPGKGTNLVGHLFNGVRAIEGEEKAAAWTVEKLGELQPQLRRRAVQHMSIALLGTEGVAALVRAFPAPADKTAIVSGQLRSFFPETSVAALKALDSPQLQAEVLMAAAAGLKGTATPVLRHRAFYRSTLDQLQLDPQSREKVMDALKDPP